MKPDIQLPDIKINQGPFTNSFNLGQNLGQGEIEHNLQANIERGVHGPSDQSPVPVGSAPAVTLPSLVVSSDDTAKASLIGVPVIASDDDLIEKEWVERAKKIVSDTKGDPYKREDQATELKVDYLQKRFGRKLGSD